MPILAIIIGLIVLVILVGVVWNSISGKPLFSKPWGTDFGVPLPELPPFNAGQFANLNFRDFWAKAQSAGWDQTSAWNWWINNSTSQAHSNLMTNVLTSNGAGGQIYTTNTMKLKSLLDNWYYGFGYSPVNIKIPKINAYVLSNGYPSQSGSFNWCQGYYNIYH
jgi:hypothetical protein